MWTDFAKASSSTFLYSYKELKAATRNFREDNKLGEGGIGEVYLVRLTNITQNCCQRRTSVEAEHVGFTSEDVTGEWISQHDDFLKSSYSTHSSFQ